MSTKHKHSPVRKSPLGFEIVVFSILILAGIGLCCAQSGSTGSVTGQVVDPQKAVVPGAEVTLVDVTTKSSRMTVTNEVGRYTFPNVPPGTYDISVALTGFSTSKLSGQKVSVGETLTLNVTLSVGTLNETVEVSAAAGAQLQMTNATVGSTMSGDSLILLPNLGRDASALSTLQVGVTPGGQVAGAANDQSTFQLDGGNNSDTFSGNQSYVPMVGSMTTMNNAMATGVMPAPIESIEEFKVSTSSQTADFNGSAGSQVQMVTKRGSNQLHGALYDYYFGSNIGAANTWLNNHTPSKTLGLPYTPLPAAHKNRFGAAAGGPMLPDFLGGKWFIFGNYEGYRYPFATATEKAVPTALMRAGVIQVLNSSGAYVPYNLNPTPVTVNGVTYQPATCGPQNTPCDPRGLGLNPVVSQIWSKYEPLPNDPSFSSGDTVNTQGYLTPVRLPQSSNFFVIRIDHDFSSKWHFMTSYRYYKFAQFTTNQIDIGGALPGDTFGQATSKSTRPAEPSMIIAGLTGTLTPHLTNDFRFSFLRNYWNWLTNAAPPQLPGLGGAVEMGGESTNALIPYNVNSQSARMRFWDGLTKDFKDDLTLLHGSHLFQFGGMYERNFDYHQRNDNGNGIMSSMVYQIGSGTGITMPGAYQPAGLPANQVSSWNNLYAEVLGMVSQPQAMFARSGPNLTLNPLGTPISSKAVVPSYSLYFSDTWHMRPTFTLTYGLGYMLEMPPYEINGKAELLVDQSGNPVAIGDYLAQRQRAALNGTVYDPIIGFATTGNVGQGLKYVYSPYYGDFSPRLAAAWNPQFQDGILGKLFGHNETVIRGGYSRIFGRLNGINQVGMPIVGVGVGQAIACIGASRSGQCLGPSGVDPTTAFRIATDGMSAPMPALTQTLPQPVFPGVGAIAAAGDATPTDVKYRVNRSDQFTVSIQRALSRQLTIEAGYIGRLIRNENQEINMDAVPYMLTLNGQRFDTAFANLYTALSSGQTVQTQPWFEAAMGGAQSAYCAQYASCTAAVAANMKSTIQSTQVYNLWSTLSKQASWTLGRTMLSSAPAQFSSVSPYNSLGYGNYNAGYLSFTARDWHGLGARSNFTWGRAFGTGSIAQSGNELVADSYDIRAAYGPQPFDIRFIYNLTMIYQPPYYKNQHGLLGHMLGGWSLAPIFTAQSGAPLQVNIGTGSNNDCQSFGEMYSNSVTAYENAVLAVPYTGGNSAHYNTSVTSGAGINGNASRGGSGINMFTDPNAIYGEFRRLILGIDHNAGGAGRIRGLPQWNVDMTVAKDFHATERVGATLMFQFTNILNHFQPADPSLNIDSPQSWGVINSQATAPRAMEFGLRIRF